MSKTAASRVSKKAKRMAKKANAKPAIRIENRIKDEKPEPSKKNGAVKAEEPAADDAARADTMRRMQLCSQEIDAALAKHHFRIVSRLNAPEWVNNGAKMIVSAWHGLEPVSED